MSFFYDLNKRMADLAMKQDLHESKVAESEKWIQKAVNPAHKGGLHKALHVAQDKTIPKAKIEKATHSKNPKLRHMAQFAKNVANEEIADEGNAFTGALAKTPKGGKFKVGGKEFTDTSSIEEKKEPRSKGTAFDPEVAKSMFAHKDEHPRHNVKDTGYSKRYTRKEEPESEKDDAEASDAPKKKGRPKGKDKGPERTTKGAWKHKGERKVKEGDISITDRGEYDDEAGMAKDSLHTIVRHAKELETALHSNENLPEWVQEKIGQIKGMMSSVTDYIISTHERDIEQHTGQEGITVMPEGWRGGMLGEPSVVKTRTSKNADATQEALAGLMAIATRGGPGMDPRTQQYLLQISKTLHKALQPASEVDEVAPPGARAERMVKGIKKSLSKDGHLSDKDKAIAYATTWKAHKAGKVEEEGAKPDFLDLDGDNNTKEPMKKAAKEKAEKKVDETTTSGSVATATASGKSSKGGMQFGKGVYEGFNASVEQMITESITVQENVEECGMEGGQPSITITADGEEAAKLMMLLKLAGLDAPQQAELDENKPDWPTDEQTLDTEPNLRTYSGGLNGPKSSGQTTIPVINRDPRRQTSMEESVELERSLFKTWKNYKG